MYGERGLLPTARGFHKTGKRVQKRYVVLPTTWHVLLLFANLGRASGCWKKSLFQLTNPELLDMPAALQYLVDAGGFW